MPQPPRPKPIPLAPPKPPTPPPAVVKAPPRARIDHYEDPLHFRPDSKPHWLIIVSLVLLLIGTIGMARIGFSDPDGGAGYGILLGFGPLLGVVALPAALLIGAFATKRMPAREKLFTTGAGVLLALSILYVCGALVASIVDIGRKSRLEEKTALAEARAVAEAVYKPQQDLANQFEAGGGMKLTLATTRAELDAKIALIDKICAANAELLQALPRLRPDVEAGFDKHDLSDEARARFWRTVEFNGDFDRARRYQELNRDIDALIAQNLRILREAYGHWTVRDNGSLLLQSSDRVDDFLANNAKLRKLYDQQDALAGVRRP